LIFSISKVDNQVDSDDLLDAEREKPEKRRNHGNETEIKERVRTVLMPKSDYQGNDGCLTTDLNALVKMDSGTRDARFCVLEDKTQTQCEVASDNKRMGSVQMHYPTTLSALQCCKRQLVDL
jgi:hypothetical protein